MGLGYRLRAKLSAHSGEYAHENVPSYDLRDCHGRSPSTRFRRGLGPALRHQGRSIRVSPYSFRNLQ